MKTKLSILLTALVFAGTVAPTLAGPDTSAAFAQRAAKEYAAKQDDSNARIALVRGAEKNTKGASCKAGSCCEKH